MIFNWIDGKTIFQEEISQYHCAEIGKVLGKLHATNIEICTLNMKQNIRKPYNWDFLLEEARKQKVEWYLLFENNLFKIKQWDKEACDSAVKLLDHQVISHRDLDPKNVIWKNGAPYVIDWEAADYVNPYQELIEVLNYWTQDSLGNYDKEKFKAAMKEYTKLVDVKYVNWDTVIPSSFHGMVGWLEYSIKRALGMEGDGDEERELGKEELIETINELKSYDEQVDELKSWLKDYIL